MAKTVQQLVDEANAKITSVKNKSSQKALSLDEISDLLPYIVQPENVARYEQGAVLIGDRSRFPFTKKTCQCNSVEEVAKAIESMITQGSGPWMAASYALVLAAREVEGKPADQISRHMQQAKQRLVATRPTNTALATRLDSVDIVIETALQTKQPLEQKVLEWVQGMVTKVYADYAQRAAVLADLIEDGDGILTNCFAETSFILGIAMASAQGKDIHVYTPETRPYLQGARLTAPSVQELGIKVTLVTDNMPAHLMSLGKIQKYVTAADLITLDGHVVNKVGTFQSAVAAQYHGIPYFPIAWGVDEKSRTKDDISIEVRNAEEIRKCMGQKTTLDSIDAYYPAFDITPPELVAGVISTQGVLSPYDLKGASL
jgi:methylthioribose-1-phosphate isomerase